MNNSRLKIAHINLQSINNKLDELKHFLATNNIGIMSINETWLTEKSTIKILNYSIVRKDRPAGKHGGGVCILIHKSIRFNQEFIESGKELEYVLIKIKNLPKKNESLRIISYYSPPGLTISNQFLNKAFASYKNLIVLGDLNAHHPSWHSSSKNQSGIRLDELLGKLDCTNLNYDFPTYQPLHRPDYFAILDFVIHSDTLATSITNFRVTDDIRSDHLTLEFDIISNTTISLASKSTKTIKKIDWDKFKSNLLNSSFVTPENINSKDDLDSLVKKLVETIHKSIEKSTVIKKIRVNPDRFMILPNHIVKLIKEKRKATREYLNTRSQEDKQKLNRLATETKKLIEGFKQNSWQKFCSSLNLHSVSDSKLWKKLHSIETRNDPVVPKNPVLVQNNQSIDNPKETANIFANLLAETFSDSEDPNFDENFKSEIVNNCQQLFINNETTPVLTNSGELQIIIENLRTRGAPGADQITNKVLKNLPLTYIFFLVDIINSSIRLSHFPDAWKHANIRMIPKPMKDHSKPENFRPISLLNTLSKLCERVVLSRLSNWIESNKIISNFQSGFSKGKQTNDHLFRFIESTLIGFNRGLSKGLKTGAIFVDIEKAFDNVWHLGLLYKLNKYNIPNYLGHWIASYLSNRTFQVKCANELSKVMPIKAGVPQGSVLGPTLFNLFFNDISEIKEENTELGMFADDVATWVRHYQPKFIEKKLQANLNNIQGWSSKWRLKISVTKTTYNIFNFRNSNLNNKIKLKYNGNPIKGETNAKFLGVTLDPGLRLKKHIDIICQRTQRRINLLKSIKGRGWGASSKIIMSTYKTLIRPIIEYAPFIPSIVSNSNRERLETIQRKAARIALGWSSRSSVKNLNNKFNSFKLEPIINRTAKLTKNYLMKASKANELIRCQIIESKQIIDPAKCPKRMTILSSITYGPDK